MIASSTDAVSTPFMLDTSVVIDLETADLGERQVDLAVVSAITVGELAFGLDVPEPEIAIARAERFRAVLESIEVLPFGVEEAKLYGVLATLVRATGNPRPRRLGLQIAATAAAARLPLLTCNPADFVGTERLVDVVTVRRVG